MKKLLYNHLQPSRACKAKDSWNQIISTVKDSLSDYFALPPSCWFQLWLLNKDYLYPRVQKWWWLVSNKSLVKKSVEKKSAEGRGSRKSRWQPRFNDRSSKPLCELHEHSKGTMFSLCSCRISFDFLNHICKCQQMIVVTVATYAMSKSAFTMIE